MIHPHKYSFTAKVLKVDEHYAYLQITLGPQQKQAVLPLDSLPKELMDGKDFVLKIREKEISDQNQVDSLKHLLSELLK